MSHSETSGTKLPQLDARITSVLRYWDGLRGNRVVPGRVEIRPSSLTRHLSRICILERPRAGTVRMRLAGATVSGRLGMELRGMPFRALFELEDRITAMDAAETAITTPMVSFLSLSRPERTGPMPEAMMAILPLADTRGGLTRALAIYSERASVTPFVTDMRGRFHIADSWSLDIPETGPIMGPMGDMPENKPVLARVLRARRAAQTATAQHLDGPELSQPVKPNFQVIDGGRT